MVDEGAINADPTAFRDHFADVECLVTGRADDYAHVRIVGIRQIDAMARREQDISEYYRVRAIAYNDLYPDGKFPPTVLVVVSQLVDPEFLIEMQVQDRMPQV